jgi:hypothetical protein
MVLFEMREEEGRPLLFETLMASIHNSVGSNQYRNMFMERYDGVVDVLNNGDLSCAYYVSCLLVPFGLIRKSHTWVKNTVHDLHASGWKSVDTPEPGCVLVWEERVGASGVLHKHIGFYVGNGNAVSNIDSVGCPQEHDIGLQGRNIISILDHYALSR